LKKKKEKPFNEGRGGKNDGKPELGKGGALFLGFGIRCKEEKRVQL